MTYTIDDVERIYLRKRGKYAEYELTDELDEVLFHEAMQEIIAANRINNGIKIIK